MLLVVVNWRGKVGHVAQLLNPLLIFFCSLAGGALTKLKLESSGALTALYQTKLQGGEKVRRLCGVVKRAR